jgi:hypothetical protein
VSRGGVLVVIAAITVIGGGVACKDKAPKQAPKPADAGVAAWIPACASALRAAATATPARRVQLVIDGCQPCGDWTPLLRWNTPPEEGGPDHDSIEAVLLACNAFCNTTAKRDFYGTIDDARGKRSDKPWRLLGVACKEQVSAVPDTRFSSAPLFALDRIARATAAIPELAPLAAAIDLPLPASSLVGSSFELATSPVTKPTAGPVHVTVSMADLRVGTLPHARFGGNGLAIDLGPDPYPGALVDPAGLGVALDTRTAGDPAARIAVIAPKGMPAHRLVDLVAAAKGRALLLAVAADGAPPGWTLLGTVPVVLGATPGANAVVWRVDDAPLDPLLRQVKDKPVDELARPQTIAIDDAATVASVTTLIGALAFRNVTAVALTRATLGP